MAVSVKVKVTITGASDLGAAVKTNLEAFVEKVNAAVETTLNMIRGMIDEQAKAMIAGSGKFGGRWIDGLHVTLDNMLISMSHDIPYADIFVTGGTISGHPLLWLPIGDGPATGEQLFSAAHSKKPLMLSINDKIPRLFGTSSVTIPAKWDVNGVVQNAMQNFADSFAAAMQG